MYKYLDKKYRTISRKIIVALLIITHNFYLYLHKDNWLD